MDSPALAKLRKVRPRELPPARGWTLGQVAAYLGVSETWAAEHREQLRRAAMPQADPLTGRYDSKAIARWMDARSGLIDEGIRKERVSDPALERVRRHANG